MNPLEELIQQLSPDLEQEAERFARFLQRTRQHGQTSGQDHANTVRDHREQYALLPELVRSLPPEMQQEVRDFVEFLLEKRLKKPRGKPTFEWAGALKDLRGQYSSVELQHRISDWRIQE